MTAELTLQELAELATSARSLLERRSDSTAVRSAVGEPPGYAPDLWDQMVSLGWTAISISEEFGGAGAGYEGPAAILHELGRRITPSPFLASAVLATTALESAAGNVDANHELVKALLGQLAEGAATGTAALALADGTYDVPGAGISLNGSRLDGVAGYVPDAGVAQFAIVAVRSGEDAALVAVDLSAEGVTVERVPTVDRTQRLWTLTLDGVDAGEDRVVLPPGGTASAVIQRTLDIATLAAAADATGAAEAVMEMSATYARERQQFGRPIGSFQAVKHHCADMAIRVEACRAAVAAGFRAAAGPDAAGPDAAGPDAAGPDAAGLTTAAHVVGSYVGPAASEVCALAVHVHGGIGFTWEHDCHMYLKRAKLDEALFGTPQWHRRRLAQSVFPAILGGEHR